MSVSNLIPIARINSTVRKRLFSILAREYVVNSEHNFEGKKESGRYSDDCQQDCMSSFSNSSKMEERDSKIPRISHNLSSKRPTAEKGNHLNVLEDQVNCESAHQIHESVPVCQDEYSPNSHEHQELKISKAENIRKRHKPRIFRRFLRLLACSPKGRTCKDTPKNVSTCELGPSGCPTKSTVQLVCEKDLDGLGSMDVEGTVVEGDADAKECHIDVSLADVKTVTYSPVGTKEDSVEECENKSNFPVVRSIGSDIGSFQEILPQLKIESSCDSEIKPTRMEHNMPEDEMCLRGAEAVLSDECLESDHSLYLNQLFDQADCSTVEHKEKAITKDVKSKRKCKRNKLAKVADEDTNGETSKKGVCDKGWKTKKRKAKVPNKLPNYFLALRVDDPVILGNVKDFQEHIIDQAPIYKHVMIAVPTLHLTLFVMRLDGENEIDKAKDALQESKEIVQNIFSKYSRELTFCGIETFRNKVVYLGLEKESQHEMLFGLQEVVSELKRHFDAKGVDIKGNGNEKFIPHATVMKMSKNVRKMKKNDISHVDKTLYKKYLTHEFGKQEFSEVLLCSMLDKKDEDGFYKVIDRIEINVIK